MRRILVCTGLVLALLACSAPAALAGGGHGKHKRRAAKQAAIAASVGTLLGSELPAFLDSLGEVRARLDEAAADDALPQTVVDALGAKADALTQADRDLQADLQTLKQATAVGDVAGVKAAAKEAGHDESVIEHRTAALAAALGAVHDDAKVQAALEALRQASDQEYLRRQLMTKILQASGQVRVP